MKQSITKYVIFDPTNKLFFKYMDYYTYDYSGNLIFKSEFTNSILESNVMLEYAARETLNSLSRYRILQEGKFVANISALIISPISITYEQSS